MNAKARTGLTAFQRRENMPGRLHQALFNGRIYARLGDPTFEAVVNLAHSMRCSIKWAEFLADKWQWAWHR